MKKTLNAFFLLLALACVTSMPSSVSAHSMDRLHEHLPDNKYRITPRPLQIRFTAPLQAGGPIGVVVRFQAISGNTTTVSAQQQWAGTSNDQTFQYIKAYLDSGEQIYLKPQGQKRWRINTNPGQWIELHYSIPANRNADSSNTQYRAILNKNLFHAVGHLFLVLPEDGMTDLVNVNVQWQDFEALNWRTAQAVAANPQQNKYEVLSKSALLSSVFLAGDIHLHETLTPYGIVRVAMQKSDWLFSDEEFASLSRQIVQSEREFFGEAVNPDAEPFLISLVEVDKGLDGISIGGTSLHNSFAMFANPAAKLMQTDFDEPNTTIGFVLAHEMMHQWIGHELKTSEDPEALGYWFTEGFTDYFSLHVLYQRRLITLENYVAMLNGFLRNYWLNPKRNIDNVSIAHGFWHDRNIERVPYQRGFLIAMLVDQRMRLVSDGRLRDMIQKMLEHSDGTTSHTAASNRSLLFNLQNRVGKDMGKHIRAVVQRGQTVDLSLDMLSPCLSLYKEAMGDFDPGFDLDRSEEDKRITGLKVASGAYRAGLRNGQDLAGWNISGNARVKSNVSVYTDKRGTTKTYEFLPVTQTTLVPQAKINEASSCSTIL